MRIQIEIPDALLSAVRNLVEREGTTLDDLVGEGLRRVLQNRQSRPAFKLGDGSFSGEGLQPEFAGADWETIKAVIRGER